MAVHGAEQRIEIAAPPAACLEAIVEHESFGRPQDAALTGVLERYGDGLGKVVELPSRPG